MKTWDFCPDRMVPKTKPPQVQQKGVSFNGWQFSAKPKVPYQKSFSVVLHGMCWYLQPGGLYNTTTNPTFNARRFELFYEEHGLWKPFTYPHPHLGSLECKFKEPVEVPEGIPNSGGLIEAFEVQLVHNNPGYT